MATALRRAQSFRCRVLAVTGGSKEKEPGSSEVTAIRPEEKGDTD